MQTAPSAVACTDSALHILSGCQHTKMRNMIIKRHNTASVLIVQALQKGPCGANQIAYTDVGSADKLSEQGLDLKNTANKTLPFWLLPKLTEHALKASSCPDAILFLPRTVCSSCLTTRNSNFQQLAKDKKLNPNQWEVHLIEFKFCEDTRPDPQLQKAIAQHSMLMTNLNGQGYREVKLHVILVGAMGTIYKDYTDKPLADLKIKKLTHKLNEHSIRHASALIRTRYALQYNTTNNSQGSGLRATAHKPPDPHLFLFNCLRGGGLPGAGTQVTPSLNYAGCVITTSGVFSFSFSFLYLSMLLRNIYATLQI